MRVVLSGAGAAPRQGLRRVGRRGRAPSVLRLDRPAFCPGSAERGARSATAGWMNAFPPGRASPTISATCQRVAQGEVDRHVRVPPRGGPRGRPRRARRPGAARPPHLPDSPTARAAVGPGAAATGARLRVPRNGPRRSAGGRRRTGPRPGRMGGRRPGPPGDGGRAARAGPVAARPRRAVLAAAVPARPGQPYQAQRFADGAAAQAAAADLAPVLQPPPGARQEVYINTRYYSR